MKKSLDWTIMEEFVGRLTDLWENETWQCTPEGWTQKYKKSINCSHPKGFSQKAHCAGKKKHNEDITMEAVCPDCGMCKTHGNMSLNEIKKGQKDSNGFTKCWPGKHAEGTKKGKNGKPVRNCVPNESQGVAEGAPIVVMPSHKRLEKKHKPSLSRGMDPAKAQGEQDARDGKPYNNPYPFKKELGAPGNWEHNSYKASYDSVKQGVAEGQLDEATARDVLLGLLDKFYADMKLPPRQNSHTGLLNIKSPGTRVWTRLDGTRHRDPGGIEVNYFTDDKKASEKALVKFWPWLLKQPGVKSIGQVSGQFGSSPMKDAVAYKGLYFTDGQYGVQFGSLSRIKNPKSVWRHQPPATPQPQDDQGVAEDWNKINHHDKTNGLSQKAVNAYRHEHPGSKLKTAVTTKPSKLKAGSKDAKRRKSFCARMSGNEGPMKKPNGEPTPKALALRRWNC
jgi:hypothetical protein